MIDDFQNKDDYGPVPSDYGKSIGFTVDLFWLFHKVKEIFVTKEEKHVDDTKSDI